MRIQDETTIAIKCILNVRCREGATIADIESTRQSHLRFSIITLMYIFHSIPIR